LIPALNSSGNGVQDDGEVQRFRVLPPVRGFFAQLLALQLVESGNGIDEMGTLCDQRALLQHGKDVLKLVFLGIAFDISHELVPWNALERVADPENVRYGSYGVKGCATHSPVVLLFRTATLWRRCASLSTYSAFPFFSISFEFECRTGLLTHKRNELAIMPSKCGYAVRAHSLDDGGFGRRHFHS